MRKKNIIFGVIGFALAVVTGGQAFAALGPGEISMGVFSIPLPGCAPDVSISDEKNADGCYTMTIQNKTLQSGVCSSSGITPTTKQVCDGRDGVDGDDVTVTEVYVPYPESANEAPNQEGYLMKLVGGEIVGINRDSCEYGDDPEGRKSKKCKAQGNAKVWPDVTGNHNVYQQGDTYIFVISDVEDGFPRYEYTAPRSSDGAVVSKGFTQRVYAYDDGRRVTETGATDECKEYAKPDNQSVRVTKCTVQDYQYPASLLTTWVPNTTTYCLGDHLSDCNQYTIPVGAVDACAGLSSDDASRTVRSTTTEYYGPTGNSSSTSRNVGYVATTQVMCSNDSDDDITATHNDPCTPASNPTVTCASGYTWQTCTNQTNTTQTYTGCFPSNLGQLFAYKDEIVPANFASDGNNLYYCQIQDCDSTSACWIDGNKLNGPDPNGKLNGTNCWGVVSIDGLQGDAGPGCSFAYYNNQWQVCCLPVDASGSVNVNGSWSCKEVTDTGILNQLNNWMCKPTYTTKYINKKGDGTYEYKSTTDNERTAATVGIRTTITNCDGTNGGDVDVFDGPAGDDYDPCDGLTAGSTAALTTVHNTTNVYVPHGNGSNGTTTGIGYYTETNVMCDTSGNKIVKKYDKCDPVSLASGASRTVGGKTCSGNQTLLMCTPQEGDLTPYPVCSDAEVSDYPKLEYVQPSESNDKFTAEGYTRWVHKYTATGSEVVGDVNQKDSCHPVYKLSRTNSNNTVTATTSSVRKCQIQSPGTTGFTAGEWYCLNTTNNVAASCNGYSDTISDSETSILKYHLPIMDGTTPTGAGYTYYEVKDGSNVTVREIRKDKDSCDLVYRKAGVATTYPETTWKCVVQTPGDTTASATYTTGHEYCLNIATGACTDYQDTIPEPDMCNGSTSATAVKKVVSRAYARSTNSQGALTSVYKMCDDTDHTESTADECKEVPTPSGQTCTNGVWMQCTRQADEGTADTTARGTTYGYCATYPQCSGTNSYSSSIVKKTQRSYTVPTKTNSENSYYTTPGKVTDVKIACDDSTISTDESAEDQCEEIPDTNSICPTDKEVLKACKRKGDENTTDKKAESTYNLCTTGTSIFGTISDAISDNDPCASVVNDATLAAKTVKKTEYEYIAKGAMGNDAGVGYVKKTKIMCDDTSSVPHEEDEYIYDTCVPQAQASGCNGASDKNYKCYKQNEAYNSASREYDACNPKDTAVALSSAVANKLDSDVTFTTGTYNNKDYILMSATGITNKPVVPVDELKPQSLFEIWKDQYKDLNNTSCSALFGAGKTCSASGNNLNESDMLANMNAYGVWKTDQVVTKNQTDSSNLTFEKYQQSLQPCQNGITITSNGTDDNGGNKYTMTCAE